MNNHSDDPAIDLVVLTRHAGPLHPAVQRGIARQRKVRVNVHRIIGKRTSADANRWDAIVRGRNEGKRRGKTPWLMFVDDDVVLATDCVSRLVKGLRARPHFAALGADYLKESGGQMCAGHVAMGAVLFRRSALEQIQFRWSAGRCECLCCCMDLRRMRMGIGYLPSAAARHIKLAKSREHSPAANAGPLPLNAGESHRKVKRPAYVLAAFDRLHCQKFQHRFLTSLRSAGNREPVWAFGYGLFPSERRQVQSRPGVRLISTPSNGVAVPIRRLLDFQGPLSRLPADSLVAYWDAGDVIFQDRLTELWNLAADHPDRVLVVAEPFGYPENEVVARWTLSISDPTARKYAFDLLSRRPCLNGGFAAGTVSAMFKYLEGAHKLLHSKALRGTTDWGDQTAMNLYCHSDPRRFVAIDERWNYCICHRELKDRQLLPEGRFARHDGRPISVIHGNGAALIPYAFSAPLALARSSAATKYLI